MKIEASSKKNVALDSHQGKNSGEKVYPLKVSFQGQRNFQKHKNPNKIISIKA